MIVLKVFDVIRHIKTISRLVDSDDSQRAPEDGNFLLVVISHDVT